MKPDDRRLHDIVECAEELAGYVKDHSMDDFIADPMLRRAAERLLTIIGEAAKQLRDETRSAIDQPWREIIRFRDKGIHSYDALTPSTLYRIATESVPDLHAAILAYRRT